MRTLNLVGMDIENRYEVVSYSYIGDRNEQQDCACAIKKNGELLAAVCDGMGGMTGGRIASRTAIEYLKKQYEEKKAAEKFPVFFQRMLNETDEKVFFLKDEARQKICAGTTLVAVGIEGNLLYWLSVGDSRLYIMRGSEVGQLTRDHNYFLELDNWYATRRITTEQYEQEKGKGEALISYVGMGGIKIFDLGSSPFSLNDGDILLLATDGLWRYISLHQLSEILDGDDDLTQKAEKLSECAKIVPDESKHDNMTFILIKLREC